MKKSKFTVDKLLTNISIMLSSQSIVYGWTINDEITIMVRSSQLLLSSWPMSVLTLANDSENVNDDHIFHNEYGKYSYKNHVHELF